MVKTGYRTSSIYWVSNWRIRRWYFYFNNARSLSRRHRRNCLRSLQSSWGNSDNCCVVGWKLVWKKNTSGFYSIIIQHYNNLCLQFKISAFSHFPENLIPTPIYTIQFTLRANYFSARKYFGPKKIYFLNDANCF